MATRQPRPAVLPAPAPISKENQTLEAPALEETAIPDAVQIARYEGNGIAYCKTCVRPLQSGLSGEPICPIGKVGCDRNQ